MNRHKLKQLSDFPSDIQEEMANMVGHLIPDGGPLDDGWPECADDIGAEIYDKFPGYIDENDDLYDICNSLIEESMGIYTIPLNSF